MGEPATVDQMPERGGATSQVDDALRVAEALAPDDRLRLIVRLWASLPPEHWAAPTARELTQVARRLNDYDARRIGEPPWEVVGQMVLKQMAHRRKLPTTHLYSAPRRFDLATIFIATAAYSLLFGLMTLLDFAPLVKLYVGALITIVGVSQALLLNVLDPRRASIVMGVAVQTIYFFVLYLSDPRYFLNSLFIAVVFCGMIGGALFGYLAGVMAAGVFLVADLLRGKFDPNRTAEETEAIAAEAGPNDDASSNVSPFMPPGE